LRHFLKKSLKLGSWLYRFSRSELAADAPCDVTEENPLVLTYLSKAPPAKIDTALLVKLISHIMEKTKSGSVFYIKYEHFVQ